jgi:hypothetical protein
VATFSLEFLLLSPEKKHKEKKKKKKARIKLTTYPGLSIHTDQFACSLGPSYAAQLSSALIKLENQNLSSPWVDWLHSAWNRSHPSLLERLDAMGATGTTDATDVESKKEL